MSVPALTRTEGEGYPACWVGGGSPGNNRFRGVVHCTGRLNLRKPMYVRETEADTLRQALVGIGPGDILFWVEGKPPIERGNLSIRVRACRIDDREEAASEGDGGLSEISEAESRRLFFDLVGKYPKISRALVRPGKHSGRDFVDEG